MAGPPWLSAPFGAKGEDTGEGNGWAGVGVGVK